MFVKPTNSTFKYIAEAQNEEELFSLTTDLLSSVNITHLLFQNVRQNSGIPIQLMQRFSDRTTEILNELSSSQRDPIRQIAQNAYVPCDVFTYKDSFSSDRLAMDLFRHLDGEGVNPFYLFSLHVPGAGVHTFCIRSTKGIRLNELELFSVQGLFLHVSVLQSKFNRVQEAARKIGMLTKREKEVLFLMAQGYTDRDIGRELSISLVTVGFHVKNAKQKLGAKNKCHAVYLSGLSERTLLDVVPAEYLKPGSDSGGSGDCSL